MKHKDSKKITNDFINMISGFNDIIQNRLCKLNEDEAKKLGLDLNDINKDAEEKLKELKAEFSKYEQKIKSL